MITEDENTACIGETAEANTTYAQDIQRIEDIISCIQGGCDIDAMLGLVSEAACLLKRCRAKLAKTGIEMESVLKDLQTEKAE